MARALMDWKRYEKEIVDHFQECYPSARITPDARLTGRFSKVERQIDLLVDDQASDFPFRIVIDAKYRNRKIDVNDVEAFLGFINDVGANTGMMVALEGYTQAALDRAYYDDLDIVLDILSFEDLKLFQGQAAIPYSGSNGAVIGAPLGWVIDATRRESVLATLYRRGQSFEQAAQSAEWMYLNFHVKDEICPNLEAVVKFQEKYLREGVLDGKIRYEDGVRNQRAGAKTLIRRLEVSTFPAVEFTGFVDFPKFVLLCVLFTPENSTPSNLRKLRFVMREAIPMSVIRPQKPAFGTSLRPGGLEPEN